MQPPPRLLAASGIVILAFTLRAWSAAAGDITGRVSARDGALEDAVVYIEKVDGKAFPPPERAPVMDQRNLTFVPHVLPILVGTSVTFPNSDVTRHNIFSPTKGRKFDLGTYPPAAAKTIRFDAPGVTALLCHVHPEMSAFVVVLETPYFGKSGERGGYRVAGVPPGRHRLAVWHESAKATVREIEVPAGRDLSVDFVLQD